MNDSMTLTLLQIQIIYVIVIISNGFANNCFKDP